MVIIIFGFAEQSTKVLSITTLFFDNFESYSIGIFPSAGDWILVWDGMGTQYQIVTDMVSYSLKKSFQLWGQYDWSSVVEKRFSTNAEIIGFEAYVMGQRHQSQYTSCSVNFWNKEKGIWGKYYASVEFTSDRIRATSPTGVSVYLQDYISNRWYKIRLVLDRSTNTFSVWIDDVLKASNLRTAESYDVNALALSSGWAGVKCYFDDVKVFILPATTISSTTTTMYSTIPTTITIPTTMYSIIPTTTTQTIPTTTTQTTTQTMLTTVKEVSYLPTTIAVTERPLFSEETIALGIALLMILASTVIGIWLRRRIVS
jgi:hypothetical protein